MQRLHLGLRQLAIDSHVLVREKTSCDSEATGIRLYVPESERMAEQLLGPILQLRGIEGHRTSLSNTAFTFPFPGFDISAHAEVLAADVINLHWPSYVLSAVTLRRLLETGKPVIWTIHDQWAFTGGCHYSAGCCGYEHGCEKCPQLRGEMQQLPSAVVRERRRQLAGCHLHVVGPSRWITNCARQSSILRGQPISHIPNGIEHDVFAPEAKPAARAALNLPKDGFYVLFGADHVGEIRKGWRQLQDALRFAIRQLGGSVPVRLIFFGNTLPELGEIEVAFHPLGYVSDDRVLRLVYNAADIFVLPSLEDNQPNTLMEAMACGTPVTGFAVGALPDIIRDGENGYLVKKGDVESLGRTIVRHATDPAHQLAMSAAARATIVQGYSLRHQAEAYLALYQNVSSHARHSRAMSSPRKPTKSVPLVGNLGSMERDPHFVRPLAQLLKEYNNSQPLFDPGWTFGRHKETRRLIHYRAAWVKTLAPWLRAWVTGDHGIYSLDRISLKEGFSEPNGPFPELHLHQMIIWGRLPESIIGFTSNVKARSRLKVGIQSPSPGLVFTVIAAGQICGEHTLDANFANAAATQTLLEFSLPALAVGEQVRLHYGLPPAITQKDNLGVAFFKFELLPPP